MNNLISKLEQENDIKYYCEYCGERLVLGDDHRISAKDKIEAEKGNLCLDPRYICYKCNAKSRHHLLYKDYLIWYEPIGKNK